MNARTTPAPAGQRVLTAVVCLAFDADTDLRIAQVRERAGLLGAKVAQQPAHRPHITLTAGRLPAEQLPNFLDAVNAIAVRHPPLPVHLNEVGQFARSGVLWLGPDRTKALSGLHRDVYTSLKRAGYPSAFAESAPYRWVPHCTIATRVPRPVLRSVRESLIDEVTPFDATLVGLATILVGGRGDVGYAPFAAA